MSDSDLDSEWRFDFPFQPETIIEAAESLLESNDAYDHLLAAELKDGFDRCEADLDDFRDIQIQEGSQ